MAWLLVAAATNSKLPTVTLAAARQKGVECRMLRLQGLDPIAERQAGKLKAKLEAARAMTFRQCALPQPKC